MSDPRAQTTPKFSYLFISKKFRGRPKHNKLVTAQQNILVLARGIRKADNIMISGQTGKASKQPCPSGKAKYYDGATARAIAKLVSEQTGELIHKYYCLRCGWFHIGHKRIRKTDNI